MLKPTSWKVRLVQCPHQGPCQLLGRRCTWTRSENPDAAVASICSGSYYSRYRSRFPNRFRLPRTCIDFPPKFPMWQTTSRRCLRSYRPFTDYQCLHELLLLHPIPILVSERILRTRTVAIAFLALRTNRFLFVTLKKCQPRIKRHGLLAVPEHTLILLFLHAMQPSDLPPAML